MKNKFRRTVGILIVCVVLFALTTFGPGATHTKLSDFIQGFSMGAGVAALIGTIYFYVKMKQVAEA